jgi:hypothetical protein
MTHDMFSYSDTQGLEMLVLRGQLAARSVQVVGDSWPGDFGGLCWAGDVVASRPVRNQLVVSCFIHRDGFDYSTLASELS